MTKKEIEEDTNSDSDETLDETEQSDDENLEPIVKEVLEEVRDKPKRGRPKGSLNKPAQVVTAVKIPKSRVKKPKKTVYVVEQEDGSLEPIDEADIVKEDVKLTKKETKALEAENLKAQTEKQLGKKVKITRKGTVDNRGVKPRTEAQIAATARLVENNRLRRLKNTEAKKEQTKELIKDSVEAVIKDKLEDKAEVGKSTPVKKPVKKEPDYSSEFY